MSQKRCFVYERQTDNYVIYRTKLSQARDGIVYIPKNLLKSISPPTTIYMIHGAEDRHVCNCEFCCRKSK